MDFTFKIYKQLLTALQTQGFSFLTFADYCENGMENTSTPVGIINPQSAIRNFTLSEAEVPKFILLRHDVEAKYGNALKMARAQHQMGIRGTYFFRIYPHRGNEEVIREIAALGHEIGYHYDDLSECKGDYKKAIQRFQKNLAYLRQFGPVTSATMEGAPLSKFDNKMLWLGRVTELVGSRQYVEGSSQPEISNQLSTTNYILPTNYSDLPKFNYRDFGIKTEPYFDIDFNEIFYLTDTGRRWDGWKVSLRDKVPGHQERWIEEGLVFRGTQDIIKAAQEGRLPQKVMITVHPQRWNDALVPWGKELLFQKVKNVVKGLMVK